MQYFSLIIFVTPILVLILNFCQKKLEPRPEYTIRYEVF